MHRLGVDGTLGPGKRTETAEAVRRHYDSIGSQEWSRLTKDVAGRVSLELHHRYLRRFVRTGSRVLEIEAGPGRFTLELTDLECQIVVTDLSPVQLNLNAAQLAGTAAESFVERRELLDVCDTSRYRDHEFDAVVAFGEPLSYAFEHAEDALRGLLRITRPDGVVIVSVMSLLGTWRHSIAAVIVLAETIGEDANDTVLRTGDTRHIWPRYRTPMRLLPSRPTPTGGAASSNTRSWPAPNPALATVARTSFSPPNLKHGKATCVQRTRAA